MIGGTDQTSTGRDRYQGYKTAMDNAGLEVQPHWRIPGPRTKQAGFEAAGQFLALPDHPTAAVLLERSRRDRPDERHRARRPRAGRRHFRHRL